MKTLLISAGLVVLFFVAAHSATIRVPEDFASVLVAVDSAAAGDTVFVGPGTWTEQDSRLFGSTTITACAFIRQPITILGAGRDVTTIDASGPDTITASVFYARQVPTAELTVEGLTLTGALVSSNSYALRRTGNLDLTMRDSRVSFTKGGVSATSAMVEDCEFQNNEYGIRSTTLTLSNCDVRDNALGADGSSTTHVENCHFEDNGTGVDVGPGEVLACTFQSNSTGLAGRDFTVHDCSFQSNGIGVNGLRYTAHDCPFDSNGTGATGSQYTIYDCPFTANNVGTAGGGYTVRDCPFDVVGTGVSGTDALVHDCTFTGTGRAASFSQGSEFRDNLVHNVVGGTPSTVGGIATGNTFVHISGGVFVMRGISSEIRNNTIYDVQGTAIHVRQSSGTATFATIQNNVIVGVSGGYAIEVENEPHVLHSFVSDGCNVLWGNDTDYNGMQGASDLLVDPQFCDAAAEDFRVPFGSLLTPEGNPSCGAIGAYPAGCPLTTHAVYTLAGYPIVVDGVEYAGMAGSLSWPPGTTHEVSIVVDVEGEDGRGYTFENWSDGGAAAHTVTATDPPSNLFADLELKYFVEMSTDGNGEALPGTGWYPADTVMEIDVAATPPFSFREWIGNGFGSYSGTANPAHVELREPLSQHALFRRKYTMTMIADHGGVVLPGTAEHFEGDRVTIHAYATDPLHEFTDWVGEGPGSYSGTADSPTITMQAADIVQTANFASTTTFQLTMLAEPGGSVSPESGEFPSGEPITIEAHADPGFQFLGWAGVGVGSYAGPDSIATAFMQQPIVQRAVFSPEGMSYQFSISASDTDPYVQIGNPTGTARNLYFWADCAFNGLAAFEGDAAGTLAPLGFVPKEGVYNLRSDGDLLLVVAGCPMEGPFLLGHWPVLDTGGTFCLEPSAENGFLGPLDCSAYTPFLYQNAGILGFSSSGETPCELGTGSCTQQPTALFFSQFRAQPGERTVEVTWYAPGSTRATDFAVHRGNAIGDGLVPLMGEIVPIEGGFRLVDAEVVANETYAYRLFALGREWSATTLVTTPNWAPRVTGFARLGPNPFRRATDIVFSMKEPAHARLAVYDVQGRLVSTLVNADLPFGEHLATWDGRTERGFAPGGVYFVKLEVGTVTQTRKIVYLAGPR